MTLSHPTPLLTCLSDLEIADLIAGRLQGEARARALRHLAECESCSDLYAEAQALLEMVDGEPDEEPSEKASPAEEALPAPLPFRPPVKSFPFIPAIAAGLTVGIALALWMPSGNPPPVAAVIWPTLGELPSVAGQRGKLAPLATERSRGDLDDGKQTLSDFALGVDWARLEEAAQRNDAEEAAAAAQRIEERLDSPLDAPKLSPELGLALRSRLETLRTEGMPPADLGELTARLSEEMRQVGYEFALGRFAEAGRLAAEEGRKEFFAPAAEPFRYLQEMQRWEKERTSEAEALAPFASQGLRLIAASWPADRPFTDAAAAFTSLIRAYQPDPPP